MLLIQMVCGMGGWLDDMGSVFFTLLFIEPCSFKLGTLSLHIFCLNGESLSVGMDRWMRNVYFTIHL